MNTLKELEFFHHGLKLYKAGLPHFPRNFTRDGILSSFIFGDMKMLRDQLVFCSNLQGKRKDHHTGEEEGKIFHEYPGVVIRNRSTLYNACDTTALFLIGHHVYKEKTGDGSLARKQKHSLETAVKYIKSHLKDGLFYEDPSLAGSNGYALKVTYWKDSQIAKRAKGEPAYPVCYTLAHVQNLFAMRCAAALLEDKELELIAEQMLKAFLEKLFDEQDRMLLALDREGPLVILSSDMLHALAYLRKGDLDDEKIRLIRQGAKKLETPLGYRTLSPEYAPEDSYHSKTVWPFEQALIHMGAKKFDLQEVAEVSSRVAKYLKTAPEIFYTETEEAGGCDPQLWTLAAKAYFKRNTTLLS